MEKVTNLHKNPLKRAIWLFVEHDGIQYDWCNKMTVCLWLYVCLVTPAILGSYYPTLSMHSQHANLRIFLRPVCTRKKKNEERYTRILMACLNVWQLSHPKFNGLVWAPFFNLHCWLISISYSLSVHDKNSYYKLLHNLFNGSIVISITVCKFWEWAPFHRQIAF